MKKYKGVVFDMDGTLLDTLEDMQYSVNIAMKEYGFPLHTLEDIRHFINNGAHRLIELCLPEDKRDEKTVTEVLGRYLEIYAKDVCIKTHPYDGIEELMKKLHDEGYKLAVVSNKPDACAKLLSDKFFGDTVIYTSGSGIGLPTKPDKECVARAAKFMGLDKEELIFVGDSCVDVLTAHNGGLECVGVTWGFHGANGFGEDAPDYTVGNANELYKIITAEK